MKILITNVSFFPAHEGGPTNALYWLASGLSHVGYEVRVVTTSRGITTPNFKFDTWQEINEFSVIYVKEGNWKRIIKEELHNSDVYIACGVCTLWGFYIRMKAILSGKKIVISPRGELFDSAIDHKGVFFGTLKRLFFQIMRICYGNKVIYHVTSEEEEKLVRKSMKTNRVYNVPNLMILPERVLLEVGTKPYFLYVGRINPIKALDKLINALAKSDLFLNSDYSLKIAGATEGDYYDELVNLIKKLGLENKIEFLGVVSGESLCKLYANAKWLFLVSDSENFGNVVIESLCQATPVIASKGTPWQILEDYHAGYWVDNDPSSIMQVVNEVVRMGGEKYSIVRDNAYQLSRKYDIYSNMDQWNEILTGN